MTLFFCQEQNINTTQCIYHLSARNSCPRHLVISVFFQQHFFFLFQIALGQRRGLSKIDAEEMSLRYEYAGL